MKGVKSSESAEHDADQGDENPGGARKLTEENKMTQRRDSGLRIPFDVETPPLRVDDQRLENNGTQRRHLEGQLLHPAASRRRSDLPRHAPFHQPLASLGTSLYRSFEDYCLVYLKNDEPASLLGDIVSVTIQPQGRFVSVKFLAQRCSSAPFLLHQGRSV